MKVTHQILASLVVGSILVSAPPVWAGENGVGTVELIPFPEEAGLWINAYFSSDGQLELLHTYTEHDSDIYRWVGREWTLIRRELRTVVPGLTPSDVSVDGSRVVLSDFFHVDVLEDDLVTTMPRGWTYNRVNNGQVFQERVSGNVSGGYISSDGRTVTLAGREHDQSSLDSLVWFGDGELVNLNADLPREGYSYRAGIPNADGSVIVFGGVTPQSTSSADWGDVWRWENGQLSLIPRLDPFGDGIHSVVDVSADGSMIFGNDEGPDRGGLSSDPLSQSHPWSFPRESQRTAWVWTEHAGTVEIIDRSRFLETNIRSVDADGTTALLYARAHGSRYGTQHVWFGGNSFIEIHELFRTLNIKIDADAYGFNEISDDGSKLMGLAWVDGRYQALIVTIPDLTP